MTIETKITKIKEALTTGKAKSLTQALKHYKLSSASWYYHQKTKKKAKTNTNKYPDFDLIAETCKSNLNPDYKVRLIKTWF